MHREHLHCRMLKTICHSVTCQKMKLHCFTVLPVKKAQKRMNNIWYHVKKRMPEKWQQQHSLQIALRRKQVHWTINFRKSSVKWRLRKLSRFKVQQVHTKNQVTWDVQLIRNRNSAPRDVTIRMITFTGLVFVFRVYMVPPSSILLAIL